jgi:hypothetical protein
MFPCAGFFFLSYFTMQWFFFSLCFVQIYHFYLFLPTSPFLFSCLRWPTVFSPVLACPVNIRSVSVLSSPTVFICCPCQSCPLLQCQYPVPVSPVLSYRVSIPSLSVLSSPTVSISRPCQSCPLLPCQYPVPVSPVLSHCVNIPSLSVLSLHAKVLSSFSRKFVVGTQNCIIFTCWYFASTLK